MEAHLFWGKGTEELEDSALPTYLILERGGHELQKGLCMEAWASSRRLPGLKACNHLTLRVPGARNMRLGCCFLSRAWLAEGSPLSPLPQADQHQLRAQSRLVFVLVCGGFRDSSLN